MSERPDEARVGLPEEPASMGQGPTLGAWGWARFVWRRLTSMTTALMLLLLLAVAAVPGSVFPQRRVDAARVSTYLDEHATTGPWLDRLGFFDVYASPWFAAIYLLLFVSLVGCVLPRARVHARAVRARPPRTPRRLAHLPAFASAVLPVDAAEATDPGAVLDRAVESLRRGRYRVDRHPAAAADARGRGDLGSVAAERGFWAETGNLLFHLALLGVLGAVAYGSLFSWSGQTLVVEGKAFANARPSFDTFRPGTRVADGDLPPFRFTLAEVVARFEQQDRADLGAARYFRADLDVTDPDGGTRRRSIEVNRPITIDGAKVYLVGNGYAPVITVRDGEGRVAWSGPVPFQPVDNAYTSTGVVKVPDAQPRQLGFAGSFLPTAGLDPARGPVSLFPGPKAPRLVLTAWAGDPGEDDLGVNDGRPQSVYTMDFSKVTQLRTADGEPFRVVLEPGQTVALPDGVGSVTFDSLRRFAAFDLHRDPSRMPALVSAGAALLGLVLSLYVRRRRMWVRVVRDDDGGLVVEAAGLSPRDDPRLAEDVARVLAAAEGRSDEPGDADGRPESGTRLGGT